MSVANGREIYVIGNDSEGNREMVVEEDGAIHDMPVAAEVTYASDRSKFPYSI